MDKAIEYKEAKNIMGKNFIGVELLESIDEMKLKIPQEIPLIKYSQETLLKKKDNYLLILGVSQFLDNSYVTIHNMINIFGKNPEVKEPCFYNQDWYNKEDFMNARMDTEWYLIRKEVYTESRAIQPNELMKKYEFPSAVKCIYSFFITWLTLHQKLWHHDYVWCSDVDHNGDRIYVGKYNDVDGINKNGFSIHRHLALRSCYGCID